MAKLPTLFADLLADKSDTERATILALDALLPQTQCGLCGHSDGCLPYAVGMTNGEPANLCVPGGQRTADKLARALNRTPLPAPRAPLPSTAVIDEIACIGCTKCLPACPVDAIIGTGKHLHHVLPTLCTGCALCVPACPVDCISMTSVLQKNTTPILKQSTPSVLRFYADDLRARYYRHINRLTKTDSAPIVSTLQSKVAPKTAAPKDPKLMVKAANLRARIKKLTAQNADTAQILALQSELLALQGNL